MCVGQSTNNPATEKAALCRLHPASCDFVGIAHASMFVFFSPAAIFKSKIS